ncbi:MAG: carboxypeptidase regulatory-like domain-containing protein [Halothece sp. Uz-M2-17]|nr:carboxypeptidase regulatory-like domain-containing protein [Halothece sp. Uz-M2-17]
MRWQLFLYLTLSLLSATPVLAHGAAIEHRKTSAIEIRATYDSGKPMANAQVTVYAPNDPTTPWLKGTTREDGTFIFVPDSDLSGNWDVKVRQSGHGDLVSIPLEKTSANTTSDQVQASNTWQGGNYTPLQKAIMAALGIWGFIGTALFFTRNQSEKQ